MVELSVHPAEHKNYLSSLKTYLWCGDRGFTKLNRLDWNPETNQIFSQEYKYSRNWVSEDGSGAEELFFFLETGTDTTANLYVMEICFLIYIFNPV